MKRIFTATLLITLFGMFNLAAQVRVYTPELSAPVNGAVDQMPDVVLDWNAVTGGNTGVIMYDIQLDTDPGFTNPVNFQTELLSAYKTSKLLFGQTYYWHVRAVDGNDVSGWSETWSFRVIRRVILSKPNEAAADQNPDLLLEWKEITGINEYDYQFDTTYYWNQVNVNQSVILYGVATLDDTHAWVTGAGGAVLFFDGISWVEQESNTTKDLLSASFVDASNGWAVGKGGTIVYFNGTDWAVQTSGTTNDLSAVHMLSATNGWAVGKTTVLHFDGTSWSSQYTASKDLSKVFAVDNSHIWAVGKGGIVIFNNGTSWSEQVSGTTRDIFSVGFSSADHGWAVGKTGLLVEYNSGTWTMLEHTLTTKDLNAVYFTAPDNAWAVGKTGTVLQFDGIEWFNQSAGTNVTMNGVALAGTIGFIAGEAGTVISYNNDAFSSPLATIQHVPGDTTSIGIKDLMFGTQYFWRMRTKHDLAVSEWSGARSFNTIVTVELDKPNDNSVNVDLDVLLKWVKISDLVTYEIQIDDDPAYGSPVFLATGNIQVTAELLKFGTEYNWRARALHAFDVSDWSLSWTFTTTNTVELESPANGAVDIPLSPELNWVAMTGIESYEVQFNNTNSFTEPMISSVLPLAENKFNVPVVLENDADYFWRVRAINGLDTSGWSPVWSFVTKPLVGVDETGLGGKLAVYPNPAESKIYIQLMDRNGISFQYTITDLVGKTVLNGEVNLDAGNKTTPVDVSALREGIYMIRMSNNENVYTKKLIIKR